jgi:hypothetical protein
MWSSVISTTGIVVPSLAVQVLFFSFFGFFGFAINPRPIVVQSTFSSILVMAFVPLRETTYMSLDKLVADIDDQMKRLATARAALVSAPASTPSAPAAAPASKKTKKRGYKMTQAQKDHLSDVMKTRWAKKGSKKAAKKKSAKVARA